jgi:hypothetical protein
MRASTSEFPISVGTPDVTIRSVEWGGMIIEHGPVYDRLATLKKKYDPSNLFRLNQNIKPAA